MKKLSYQGKARLRKILRYTGMTAGCLLILGIARFIYLGRYIVYDGQGAHLDFSQSIAERSTVTAVEKAEDFPLKQARSKSTDAYLGKHFNGWRLQGKQVQDPKTLDAFGEALTDVGAMMIPVKGATGSYFYDSQWDLAEPTESKKALRDLIQTAKKQKIYLIAELPAFADSEYAKLDHGHSLQIKGGALWMNADGSYCLDPANRYTEEYLLAQLRELKSLGFDEVLLRDFDFPTESRSLVYDGDGLKAIRELSNALLTKQGKDPIQVSFLTSEPDIFALSAHRYVFREEDADPEDMEAYVYLAEAKPEEFGYYSTLYYTEP